MLGLGGLGGYLPGQVPGGSTGFSGAAQQAAQGGGGMTPLMASLLSKGAEAGMPYLINAGANLYDSMRGVPDIQLGEQEKVWSDLEQQMNEQNQEAIRRALGSAGMAVGGNMAMSGAAGLSSFNPVLAAMARQGELQAGRVVSGLERRGVQDRADYQTSRADAINKQLMAMRGTSTRRGNVAEGYARASQKAGNLADAERYRAAASSVG
jgi:hypothetical protein